MYEGAYFPRKQWNPVLNLNVELPFVEMKKEINWQVNLWYAIRGGGTNLIKPPPNSQVVRWDWGSGAEDGAHPPSTSRIWVGGPSNKQGMLGEKIRAHN